MWIILAFLLLVGQTAESIESTTKVLDTIPGIPGLNKSAPEPEKALINATTPGTSNTTGDNDKILIGSSLVSLSVEKCDKQECILGNFVTDAMVFGFRDENDTQSWSYSSIAFINSEVLHDGLEAGDIYLDDLKSAVPYDDVLIVGEIKGRYIKEIFEYNCSTTHILQVSGIKVSLDFSLPQGERVKSLKMRCQNCTIPVYERIDLDKVYRVITTSSLANHTNYTIISEHLSIIKTGNLTGETFKEYLTSYSPIFKEESGRIIVASGAIKVLPSLFGILFIVSAFLIL